MIGRVELPALLPRTYWYVLTAISSMLLDVVPCTVFCACCTRGIMWCKGQTTPLIKWTTGRIFKFGKSNDTRK